MQNPKNWKKQPEWKHVDDIKAYEEDKSVLEDSIEMPNAKPHAKKYILKTIVGERGKTRRTKQFKILWSDASTTWEPASNRSRQRSTGNQRLGGNARRRASKDHGDVRFTTK